MAACDAAPSGNVAVSQAVPDLTGCLLPAACFDDAPRRGRSPVTLAIADRSLVCRPPTMSPSAAVEAFAFASKPFPSTRRLAIDALSQRDSRQLLVGGFFLVEIGCEQPHDILASELVRPRDQGAIASDLIGFDRLC